MVISLDIQPTGWFEQFECVGKWFQLRKNGYLWNIVGYSTYLSNCIWFEQLGWFWKWCTCPDVCSLNDEIVERTCLFFEGLPSVRQNPDSKDWSQQQPLENDHGNGVYHVGVYPKSHDIVGAMHHIQVPFPLYSHVFDGPMFIVVFCYVFCIFHLRQTYWSMCVRSLFVGHNIFNYIYKHIRYHMFCWLNIVSIGRYHNFHIIPLL